MCKKSVCVLVLENCKVSNFLKMAIIPNYMQNAKTVNG